MSRGFKRDVPITKMLRANGLLLDRRSFVGYDLQMIPHLLLKGDDLSLQRERVYRRCKNTCAVCKNPFDFVWEMDHIEGGTSGRCDCLHNLQALHPDCHTLKHGRIIGGKA